MYKFSLLPLYIFVFLDCCKGALYFSQTDKCYKVYNLVTLNWFDARWNCREMGRNGDLASISERLIGPVSGSFPSEVFEMNTYLSLE